MLLCLAAHLLNMTCDLVVVDKFLVEGSFLWVILYSPLIHVRKVVSGMERKLCQYLCEIARKHMSCTDLKDHKLLKQH